MFSEIVKLNVIITVKNCTVDADGFEATLVALKGTVPIDFKGAQVNGRANLQLPCTHLYFLFAVPHSS